ncbi:zinc metalloprotease [Actinomadura atramentaria]|uniref:zinc metalloprotease n=1 Tax=Actinomadura atramentaria TaxID=1990 RepID=UPI0003808C71|nr:zinc metalloprotease [Actinomadura atramentaria]
MKPLAAVAALLAAALPAAASVPDAAQPATARGPAQAGAAPSAPRGAGDTATVRGARNVSPAAASGAAPGRARVGARGAEACAGAAARVRAGTPAGVERNELTPAEAAAADRDLAEITRRLGLDGDRSGARVRATLTIPVYFHVLHDGARGNVPTAQIKRQIATMNAAYGGRKGGADTGVRFALKKISRSDNGNWYAQPEDYEKVYKPKLRIGGAGTLNLYTAKTGSDLLGFSTFPWKYAGAPKLDGVLVDVGTLPGGDLAPYNLGYSAVHETGHWLGLFHTFQDGCGGKGDRVADTPPEEEATHGCPADKDTCPADGHDPVHNFMDYADDACMHEFTAGQGARIRKAWAAYRAR